LDPLLGHFKGLADRVAMTRAVVICIVAFGGLTASAHAASPGLDVFAPTYFSSADLNEQVRFSWYPNNSQDFFRIVVSDSRYTGWNTAQLGTRKTVLNSIYASPAEMGLGAGTWYWRVCYGWYDDPNTCYLDDDIRTLEVTNNCAYWTGFYRNVQGTLARSRAIYRRRPTRANRRLVQRGEALVRQAYSRVVFYC
jgi:hypothetical protein